MDQLISKAAVLLEALPYVQRFRDQTFVVKYGGSFMDSPAPEVRTGVARDVVFLEAVGIDPVVVHGGGKAISRAMEESGLQTKFIQGMRVTDEEIVKVVDDTLSRKINPEIVETITKLGGRAKGFAGTEVFKCEKFEPVAPNGEKIDLGYVGQVTEVNVEPLMECVRQDITPVISPTAIGPDGKIYNCNADIAAAKAAIALKASRLVFMSDVPGLMRDPSDETTLIPRLRTLDVADLKTSGVISQGMIPKVDSAVGALHEGVHKVSFVDGRVNHAVLLEIFTDAGVGTEIVL